MPENPETKKSFFGSLGSIIGGSVQLVSAGIDNALQKSYGAAPSEFIRLALDHDPQQDLVGGSFLERQSQITFEQLRKMSERDVIVAAIIARRSNQIALFARPTSNRYSTGFKITLKAKEMEGNEKVEQIKEYLTSFLLNTGRVTEDRPSDMRNSFDRFLRLMVHDLLVFDCVAVEKIHDNEGGLFAFLPVAADSIRYCFQEDTDRLFDDLQEMTDTKEEQERIAELRERYSDVDPSLVKYKQVHQGRVAALFTEQDLFYTSFTPSNNLMTPYSVPPLEKAVNIVSSHLFAEATNRNYFTQGGGTKGILHLQGDIPVHQLEAFRRQFYYQVASTKNAWRTPIISTGGEVSGINFIPLQETNKDMEWANWMSYLVKCLCAIYLIDPNEIGWFSERGGGLGDSGNKIEKQTQVSKDNGLRPILRFIEDFCNEIVIKEISLEAYELFRIEFVDVDQDDEVLDIEKSLKKMNWQSINEIRAANDLEEINDPSCMMPANPFILQVMQMNMQQQQMQLQAEQLKQQQKDGGDEENKDEPSDESDGPANSDGKSGDEEPEEKSIKIEWYTLKK